jgi:hypothetical protein
MKEQKRRRTFEEEAFTALESDVMRAGSLAKDLGIPRPPLFVAAPLCRAKKALAIELAKQKDAGVVTKLVPLLKGRNRNYLELSAKIFVSLLSCVTVIFYMYACGFRSNTTIAMNYAFHLADLIFALDFGHEMIQVVITPQSKDWRI